MTNTLISSLQKTKQAAKAAATVSPDKKRLVLLMLADLLHTHKKELLRVNSIDQKNAVKKGKDPAFIDRLTLTETTMQTMIQQIREIAAMENILGSVLEKKHTTNGVRLEKIRVPLGVIAVIYESRPSVTVDVAALCLQSGNAVILKGGSEALLTNTLLISFIHQALTTQGIPKETILFLKSRNRNIVSLLLQQHQYIDVVIPRGGYDLVKKVVAESTIPVLYHANGGARIYVDASADISMGVTICVNAKTSRPATCNSVDTVLVHEKIADKFLPLLDRELKKKHVTVLADEKAGKIIQARKAVEKDFAKEFLDFVLTIKVVTSANEALEHISRYSKQHTECIIASDKKIINTFVQEIDAAGIFINCSPRLHDGGVFGMGAEMGIATGKLHARGPVGLKELTSYKWIAYGSGQIRE